MADGKIHLDLVSPERLLLSDDVDMVTVPGADGYFGVLPGHAPIMTSLRPGVIEIKGGIEDGDMKLFIRGGFAEVTPTQVSVLAEEAIPFPDFTVEMLDQRIKDAEEEMIAAATEGEKQRVNESLDQMKLLRSVFNS
jgi:F-type H+-transporting ATPase subunit epsilon